MPAQSSTAVCLTDRMQIQHPDVRLAFSALQLMMVERGKGLTEEGAGTTPESRKVPGPGAREGRAGQRMILGLFWNGPGERGGPGTSEPACETVSGAGLFLGEGPRFHETASGSIPPKI